MAVKREEGSLTYEPAFSNEAFAQELYGRRVYRYDAISGAQIAVYFKNKSLISDATAIQFALSQSKKPIYGYHSQHFDTVADGIVIVQGRLFINFIHQGYLRLLLKRAQDPNFLEKIPTDATRSKDDAKSGKTTYDGVPNSQESLIRHIRETNKARQDAEIAGTAKLYRPDLSGATAEIKITYASDTHFPDIPFKTLSNVHFIGESQEIQISGQPIQEVYEFIAQKVT